MGWGKRKREGFSKVNCENFINNYRNAENVWPKQSSKGKNEEGKRHFQVCVCAGKGVSQNELKRFERVLGDEIVCLKC